MRKLMLICAVWLVTAAVLSADTTTVKATTDFAVAMRKGSVEVVFTGNEACKHYIVYEDCDKKELKCFNFLKNNSVIYKKEYDSLIEKGLIVKSGGEK